MPNPGGTGRVAAIGELNCTKTSQGGYQQAFAQVAQFADVLVSCVGMGGDKGLEGGLGGAPWGSWGDHVIKQLVQEAIAEAQKLEAALVRLRPPQRIAVLHYAPIRGTVENEPLEIYPFLGCSR